MRKTILTVAAASTLLALSACGGKAGGVINRERPDEFATARHAPLVIPPDFALTPPRPGAPRPQEADSSTQALQAMFGGAAVRSAAESGLISAAGGVRSGTSRSNVTDPNTNVVDKGAGVQDILNAPETTTTPNTVSTPQ